MPLLVSNGVLVRLIWAKGGVDHAVNVYGATGVGAAGVTQALADALGAAIKSQFTTSGWNTVIHPSVSLSKIGVRSVSSLNQPEFLDNNPAVNGGSTGNLMPPQVAFLVTLRTALAGKEFRGRTYLGGMSVGAGDANGLAVAGVQTTSVAFVNGIKTAMSGSGLTMAVLSRKLNQANAVTLVQSRNSIFETQRRRATPGV